MLQWRFSEDLEQMRETLVSIEAVLQDAERRSIENTSVRLWLERITRASYDISDLFDEFELDTAKKSGLRKYKVLNPLLTFASEVGMAGKMKKVRKKLEDISKQRQEFSFTAGNSCYEQKVIDERETSWEAIEANILGRDQEKQKVITHLTEASSSSELIILPIYGIGGIGKTTLAQLLFNDTHFKDYEKTWVYVSQTFDLKKIGDSIRSQLQNNNQSHLTDIQEPNADPPALNKILIVLDDLWENDDFKVDDLKNSLKMFCDGRRVNVIVTTRDAGIARKIQTSEAYKIEPLSSDVCWTIIQHIVGFEDNADKARLEDIGKEIAIKCQGVALAARALGYMLRSRNFDGWISVNDNGMWNISKTGYEPLPYDNVLASLKLSYTSILPYLRLCFAYCAIFPKGHKMAKDDLIYQWAALGFIKSSNEDSMWPQRGESSIKQLLGMSFLQHSKSTLSYGQHGKNVTLFTMHDLVHDLARSIIRDEVLDTTIKCNNTRGSNCRYVSLADCTTKPLNSFVTYPDKIRALRFLGSVKIGRDAAGFSTAKYMRVLDLGECSIQKLPSSIGQLKLLRYLNAPGIKGLPESIGELEDLKYLDLSACPGIAKLPNSFQKLKSLVHLDLSYCSVVDGISEALFSLTKLRYLNLSRKEEWIYRCVPQLPEVIGKLIELRYLNLSNCGGPVGSFVDVISTLSNLEHLDLSNNTAIYTIPDSFCSLSKLHTLDLTGCYNLERLPKNVGGMDTLKFLIVKDCWQLDMSNLQSNNYLIPLPKFVVHAAGGEQSSNLVLLKDVSTPELELSRLENVKSVEEARTIKLREKQSTVKLTLGWTEGRKGFVEDMELLRELVPPSSLEQFELRGYNDVIFPTWLMDIAMYLPNLVSVSLKDVSQCSSLPPLGQLPNLASLKLVAMSSITKIDRGFCGGAKAFIRLGQVSMFRMESLEEWTTAYSDGEGGVADEFMFPNLKNLKIDRCQKLRLIPRPPRVEGTWHITESDGVLSQWGESSPHTVSSTSSSLRCLFIESSMVPVDQWKLLRHLPVVKELIIKYCNDLNSSSDIVGVSCSLRELTLLGCDSMQSLPQWLGHLTTLKELRIRSCRSLNNLPEWLGDLVSLKDLNIYDCGGMCLCWKAYNNSLILKVKHLELPY
ncbi:Disease resistance protein RGA2 [Dichanthelium oligosanthes]|uniref:Disease resistance protein RGA2 n=1 Tax=Dichanthelium oligosanthes TaxID=888268 RepID=A0A1E5WBR4_9POAL|nr:Disease resistance protein RGA2 [Dichanthelium oligosanthes]